MTSRKKTDILGELHQAKQALIASEKRGRKAVNRMRALESAMAPIVERMRQWMLLPVSQQAWARVMTTEECDKLLVVIDDDKEPKCQTSKSPQNQKQPDND